MSGDTDPLDRGESRQIDTGTVVTRKAEKENWFDVANGAHDISLEDEEIRQIAELAGYDVSDPA